MSVCTTRSSPTCPSYLPADFALKAPCGLFVVDFRVHFKAGSHTSICLVIYFILQCVLASVDDIIVGGLQYRSTFTSSHHAHQIPPACDPIAKSFHFVVLQVFLPSFFSFGAVTGSFVDHFDMFIYRVDGFDPCWGKESGVGIVCVCAFSSTSLWRKMLVSRLPCPLRLKRDS